MTLRSVHRQRNDDRRTVGLGSTRGRHIPADGRRVQSGYLPFCLTDLPGHFSSFTHPLAGSSLQRQRCHGRPVEHRAPGRFRVPLNSRKQTAVHAVQSYLADLPKTHRSLSCVSGFDVPKHELRGIANDQFIVGEIRNV